MVITCNHHPQFLVNIKMKTIRIILSLSFICFTFSCINDLGNYNYISEDDLIPVTIADLKDTTMTVGETLEIVPNISIKDDESLYSYLWYVIKPKNAGAISKRDTLGTDRNLSALIKIEPGEYKLYLEVRKNALDIYINKTCTLKVEANNFSLGWYVLKNVGDETDFDYIPIDGSPIIPDILRTQAGFEEYYNGPAKIGDQQLKGKALKITWQSEKYSHFAENQDATYKPLYNQRVFHIVTDKEIKTFNANNLYQFKNFNDEFYEAPTADVQNFESIDFIGDIYVLNAGKIHTINGNSLNAGKFTNPYTCIYSLNYKLHSNFFASYYGAIVFDTVSRSFFHVSTAAPYLNKIAEKAKSGLPSLFNMEYDLVRIINKAAIIPASSYFLMKHVSNGKYFLANVESFGDPDYPFTSFREVSNKAKMLEADVFAAPLYASCVYFGKNNILSYYVDMQDTSLNEKVIMTFPADETIAFINSPDPTVLLVLTNNASGWKLYGFPVIGSTADIVPEAKFIHSGKGEGRYVLDRIY